MKGKIWNSSDLLFLGYRLLNKGETGYGLLCILAPALSLKIGTLLDLKWKDFIDPISDECKWDLNLDEDKHRVLNNTVQRNITDEFEKMGAPHALLNDFVFTRLKKT